MKPKFFVLFALLVGVSFFLTVTSNAQELLELERQVKGTSIDVFPNYVEVITSNPRAAASKLFAAGGDNLAEDKRGNGRFTIFHRGVLHIFHTVADYKTMLEGHTFRDGDIVYKYWLDSESEEKEFVKRFGLQVAQRDCRVGETPITLYTASPGFFVICSGKRAIAAPKTELGNAAPPTEMQAVARQPQETDLLDMERKFDARLDAALRSYRASDTLGHAMMLQRSKEEQTRYWRCRLVLSILSVWEARSTIDEFHGSKDISEEFSIPHCHLVLNHLGIKSADEFFIEVEGMRNRELYSWPEYLDPHSNSHSSFRHFLEESLSRL